jgi:hypothetical protein
LVSDRLHGEMQSGWIPDMLLVKGTQVSLTVIWLMMSWDTLISSKYMIVVMRVLLLLAKAMPNS